MHTQSIDRRAYIRRTSHEFRLAGGGRYALTFEGELVASANDPTGLFDLADSFDLTVEQRNAWISVLAGGGFEVDLFERGLLARREFATTIEGAALASGGQQRHETHRVRHR